MTDEIRLGIVIGCLLVQIAAVLGCIIGLTEWFDKLMSDTGDWIETIHNNISLK